MHNLQYDKDYFEHPLFFALSDNMREGAAIIEAASRKFVYCNQSFLNMFGIDTLADIDITLLRKLRKDKLSNAAIDERVKIIKEKGVFYELVEYRSLKGGSFFAEATARLYSNKGVDYYLYVITPVDKAFFEIASLGMLMVNTNGEIVTVNSYILKEFGYRKKELIGKKIEILIPKRFHQQHIEHRKNYIQQLQNRPMGLGLDLFAIKKDGSEIPVEVSLGNYCTDGHNYTIVFISDISVRKEAEMFLKTQKEQLESKVDKRNKDLRKTLKQLEKAKDEQQNTLFFQKALLDNAGAIIVSVDNDGIIQSFNPEAEARLGYKAIELIGKHTPLIFHDNTLLKTLAAETAAELQRPVPLDMELFLGKARRNLHHDLEWVYIRKDGTKFPVQLNISAVTDEHNEVIGFVGIAFDISKIKKIEADLQRALETEKELSELKSRFISMASHEFRTPLSTVLSSAYLVEKYPATDDQPKREKHLQRIVSSVNLLSDILNDFLSVGKIEEGKIQLKLAEFDLKKMVTGIADDMQNNLKPHQNILYKHSGKVQAVLDISLMKHILMNLISNAIKFSPENSVIEIYTACKPGSITLAVKDHGIGISKEDQQHLMERFFRGTNAATIQGTGLGLHIVSKYAELMNGTLKCESELDKGTTFTLVFKK
jgi:PAS domain S-box-containing protein